MFTRKDRDTVAALEGAVARLVKVVSDQNTQLEQLRADLNEALDRAAENDAESRLQAGISNIMSFTGAPKRGDGK